MTFPNPFYRWRPHPWHGLDVGPNPPAVVHACIEITPFDLVKYEIDKATGYLKVDRPQRTSSLPPSLYGFIPKTFCGERVGGLMPEVTSTATATPNRSSKRRWPTTGRSLEADSLSTWI